MNVRDGEWEGSWKDGNLKRVKPRRMKLVIGLSFSEAKLEVRTKGPINKERGHSPKQS